MVWGDKGYTLFGFLSFSGSSLKLGRSEPHMGDSDVSSRRDRGQIRQGSAVPFFFVSVLATSPQRRLHGAKSGSFLSSSSVGGLKSLMNRACYPILQFKG